MAYPHFFQVAEWLERRQETEHSIVFVKEHKTAAHFVVGLALSKQEEEWFDRYYRFLRPQHLVSNRKRKRDEQDEKNGNDFFFVSSTGKKIHNPTNDLHRLHEKYNLPKVTSQLTRRVFETAANSLDDSQKQLVSAYLAHSVATADRYRMKTLNNIVATADLICKMSEASR